MNTLEPDLCHTDLTRHAEGITAIVMGLMRYLLGKMSLHLQVLRVCREIYAEAALLPFALNDFSCEDPVALKLSRTNWSLCRGTRFNIPYGLATVDEVGDKWISTCQDESGQFQERRHAVLENNAETASLRIVVVTNVYIPSHMTGFVLVRSFGMPLRFIAKAVSMSFPFQCDSWNGQKSNLIPAN